MIEVVCGALIKEEKVLIAKRSYGAGKGMFEFPGGKVEPNETKEEALIREWKEECKIDIQICFELASSDDCQEYPFHLTCFVCTAKEMPVRTSVHSQFIWTTAEHIYDYPFFESDRKLVKRLQEVWPCLIKQMKQKY